MPARLDPELLAALAQAREVEIETGSSPGTRHRAIIWVVVDGPDAFIRSWRGASARWYREALGSVPIRLHVDGRAVDVAIAAATSDADIERVSRAFERKYAGDPSTPDMVRPEILETTLQLLPA